MAKKRKQTALWLGFLWGGLLALGVYLLGLLLLALLMVKGTLENELPVIAALSAAAALCGGLTAIWRTGWRAGGLLTGVIFAAFLALTGLLLWDNLTWLGMGGLLLLCAVGGGLIASLAGGRKRKRKRK